MATMVHPPGMQGSLPLPPYLRVLYALHGSLSMDLRDRARLMAPFSMVLRDRTRLVIPLSMVLRDRTRLVMVSLSWS